MSKEPSSVQGPLHTSQVTVGTTAAQLATTGRKFARGVTLKADTANAGVIYVGGASNVSSTIGYPLLKDETVFIPTESLDQLWLVASVSAQALSIIGM